MSQQAAVFWPSLNRDKHLKRYNCLKWTSKHFSIQTPRSIMNRQLMKITVFTFYLSNETLQLWLIQITGIEMPRFPMVGKRNGEVEEVELACKASQRCCQMSYSVTSASRMQVPKPVMIRREQRYTKLQPYLNTAYLGIAATMLLAVNIEMIVKPVVLKYPVTIWTILSWLNIQDIWQISF